MPEPAPPLVLAPEVAAALGRGRPVVALESTIIAHGLPRPDNLVAARAIEAAVREGGAVPATIAVLDGRLHVGLDAPGLARLAGDPGLAKLSRADLAACMAAGGSGATTVAATMIAAAAAGIAVFATGGIGGVHRGGERSLDVSADLEELARTPVCVVASGAKSILDLERTLERLETLGVPVIAVGQDAFPGFWCRDSGLAAPLRMDRPEAIAAAFRMRRALGIAGGQLVANPVPAAAALGRAEVEAAVAAALAAAAAKGIAGKAVTPFLLAEVRRATAGRSLAANLALVLDNARLAARIAAALAAFPATPA